jgi:hypothetical protein
MEGNSLYKRGSGAGGERKEKVKKGKPVRREHSGKWKPEGPKSKFKSKGRKIHSKLQDLKEMSPLRHHNLEIGGQSSNAIARIRRDSRESTFHDCQRAVSPGILLQSISAATERDQI